MKDIPPLKMRAVIQDSSGGPLSIKEVDLPSPARGEVLVKMAFAPVNPSDLSQLQGTFTPLPSYPFTPGIEGSGVVVGNGKGIIPALRSGKRVACSSKKGKGGSWAEYMVTSASNCVPINKNISFEAGSMLLVNPMTVIAFMDIIKTGRHKSIVNNAAGSALGIMLQKMCSLNGIELINIVRNEKRIEDLQRAGAKIILNSSEDSFSASLKKISHEKNSLLFFDAVGGRQTEIMTEVAPPGSKIVLYARLSEESFTIDSRTLLQHGKIIDGFSLPLYTRSKSIPALLKMTGRVKSMISKELSSSINKKYSLESINDAISDYKGNMGAGKILLNCSNSGELDNKE